MIITYCDMMPESRNNPLLDNGSLKHLFAATDTLVEIKELLQDWHMFRNNGQTPNIDELFEVVISTRFARVIKGGHVIDSRVSVWRRGRIPPL
jgi:hypothetical protein